MHEGQRAHVWVPSYSYEQNGTPTNDTCCPLMHTATTQQSAPSLQRSVLNIKAVISLQMHLG